MNWKLQSRALRDWGRACSLGPWLLSEHRESAALGEAGCVMSARGCLYNSVACKNEPEPCPVLGWGVVGVLASKTESGGYRVECGRTPQDLLLLWQHAALTSVLGLTPQPCFGCQLGRERAGMPSHTCASRLRRTHMQRSGSHF